MAYQLISYLLLNCLQMIHHHSPLSMTTAYELNKDLQKIAECAHHWKMTFNPDLNKQVWKVIFSSKMTKSSHPQISLNNVPVPRASFQKHLGIYLDEKFNFNNHIKEKMTKAIKEIGVIKRLRKMPPQHSLLTIYIHI